MTDITEKLKDLAALYEKGLLTREEFEQQKTGLIAGGAGAQTAGGDASSAQPTSVGSYQILGEIGKGGMGQVYRARHRSDSFAERQGGDVAIKVMHAHYSVQASFQDRFEREGSLGVKLDHPGIVKVYDLVQEGDTLALVMELIEGRPLSETIGAVTGPIPWQKALPLFGQLLDAVGHAHEHGVVHRDLKPENVMVTSEGTLKILDFGIAKDVSSGRTKTGTGMGTVDYMAPEQYTDAKNVDQRADIYALGTTLYEMLAGRLPWEADSAEYEILKVKESGTFPPPTEFYPDIPQPIVAVIKRALAVIPAQRLKSTEGFAKALSQAQAEEEQRIALEQQKAQEAAEHKKAREEAERLDGDVAARKAREEATETKKAPAAAEEPKPETARGGGERSKVWLLAAIVLLVVGGLYAVFGDDQERREENGADRRTAKLEKKIEELEQELEQKGPAGRPPGPAERPPIATAEQDKAAGALLREANELAKGLKYNEAKAKLAVLQKKYGTTRAARSAARLSSELDVIGKEAGSLNVEKWFVGNTSFDSGEATLVVFWELWCPHCRREVPKLQETYNSFRSKGLNMVALTKVTKSSTDEKVAEFIAENNLTYPIAKERGDEMSRRFNIRGIPAAVVLKNDKVVWRGHPAQLSNEMIENWL